MPPVRHLSAAAALSIVLAIGAAGADDARSKPRPAPSTAESAAVPEDSLGMSKGVVCRSIDGYEDYEPLPNAAQTSDEKLLIYYRPLRFRVEKKGSTYHAHLTEDARLRRKGQKAVLFSKNKMVEYKPKSDSPFDHCYIRSNVSIKGLKPGEYEFDIILHDELTKATATQTVGFRVVVAAEKKSEDSPKSEPDPEPEKPKSSDRR